jgi:hypothetical protein
MIDLITGPDSDCGAIITPQQRQAAFNTFTQITGLTIPDPNATFDMIATTQDQLLNINAFYIFFPTFLLLIIAIWLLVGVGWVIWPVGLFLSVLIFIILYGFSILYRIQAQDLLLSKEQQFQNIALTNQANFQNSVALWPQGLFAVACAVTSTGGTGWTCNNPPDSEPDPPVEPPKPAPNPRRGPCRNGPCSGIQPVQAAQAAQVAQIQLTATGPKIASAPTQLVLPPPPAPLIDMNRQTIHQLRRRRIQN